MGTISALQQRSDKFEKTRERVRAIGYAYLIVCSISLVVASLLLVSTIYVFFYGWLLQEYAPLPQWLLTYYEPNAGGTYSIRTSVKFLGLAIFSTIAFICVQIFGSYSLIRATDKGRPLTDAIKLTERHQTVQFVLVCFEVGMLMMETYFTVFSEYHYILHYCFLVLINITLRMFCIFIVEIFLHELTTKLMENYRVDKHTRWLFRLENGSSLHANAEPTPNSTV